MDLMLIRDSCVDNYTGTLIMLRKEQVIESDGRTEVADNEKGL